MAPTSVELAFVQCDRTLMGMPNEILRSILEHVVGEEASITYEPSSDEGPLSWDNPWVPELILVSRDFGAMGKEVIAKAASLMFVEKSQARLFEEALKEGTHEG
ncbi:uncharacterized protein AB675_7738 [Cyphellophora attinorum]|uniref:Uncharacterized protein n=1 Tax=Cyphellophora attinorum TaxID=1664694 RepID=A0A0N1NYT9_9EURO|nr:uncharacterized protein AB675_7738 [Phialophora attinorum]KPI40423.1 hypothetical protein AB675_7738 [Phialophora attinorum]